MMLIIGVICSFVLFCELVFCIFMLFVFLVGMLSWWWLDGVLGLVRILLVIVILDDKDFCCGFGGEVNLLLSDC